MHNWIAIVVSVAALAFSIYTYYRLIETAEDERTVMISSSMFSNKELYDLSVDYTNYREAMANDIDLPSQSKTWGHMRYIGYLNYLAKLANEGSINTDLLSNWLLCDMQDAAAIFEREISLGYRTKRDAPDLKTFVAASNSNTDCRSL